MNKVFIRSLLTAVFLILLLILILLFRSRSPFGKGQTSFASEPKNEITRIELFDGDKRLFLTSRHGKWFVNDRQEARESGVIFLIRIITEMKIKSPVSPELFNAEITEKAIRPIRVKVFENSKLLRSFFVYKTGSNKYGNIMKIKQRSKPFIVYVPGFEGDIGSGFVVNDLYWQPYTLFNLLPSEISSVTFENLQDSSSSFSISHRNNSYTISDLNTELTGYDNLRIARYISYFTFIPFEKWAFDIDEIEKNRIESGNPLFTIKAVKTTGTDITLKLWRKYDIEKNTIDTDRLWAKTGNHDELFIVRYFDIDPVLKKRSYFFPE